MYKNKVFLALVLTFGLIVGITGVGFWRKTDNNRWCTFLFR